MNIQTIEIAGEQAVVLPLEDYQSLVEKAEMFDDIAIYDEARASLLTSGSNELIPDEVLKSLLDGENAVKVWRNFRGISQQQLASMVNVSQAYLAQIETGKREGGISVYQSLAKALSVDLDDLCG